MQTPATKAQANGPTRLGAILGFGRQHIAPALSKFARLCPEVGVQLHLTDQAVNIVERGFDLHRMAWSVA